MESQQQPPNDQQEGGGGSGKSGSSSYLCRQSSTRWTPTTDQIRILKELYYNNGVRSPTADQIQRISARLRQYGKIEGKNVFYWFQNHKARERQKKRFTTTNTIADQIPNILYNKYPIINTTPAGKLKKKHPLRTPCSFVYLLSSGRFRIFCGYEVQI